MTSPSLNTGRDFVERMGLAFEEEGFPRIAGRMIGLLLLQSSPCSLDDIASTLGVSKASVSTDARRLEQVGIVERTSFPGDRRDYYVIAPDFPLRGASLKLAAARRMPLGAEELARVGAGLDPIVQERLRAVAMVHGEMIATLEQLVERLRALPPLPSPASGSGYRDA